MSGLAAIETGTFKDAAYGCILGAFCGDSIGSYLEFTGRNNEKTVEECLKIPGGGPHMVGPGQITDDSELALCLMQALLNSDLQNSDNPL